MIGSWTKDFHAFYVHGVFSSLPTVFFWGGGERGGKVVELVTSTTGKHDHTATPCTYQGNLIGGRGGVLLLSVVSPKAEGRIEFRSMPRFLLLMNID